MRYCATYSDMNLIKQLTRDQTCADYCFSLSLPEIFFDEYFYSGLKISRFTVYTNQLNNNPAISSLFLALSVFQEVYLVKQG